MPRELRVLCRILERTEPKIKIRKTYGCWTCYSLPHSPFSGYLHLHSHPHVGQIQGLLRWWVSRPAGRREARAGAGHVPGLELLLVFTPTPSLLRILSWGFKGTWKVVPCPGKTPCSVGREDSLLAPSISPTPDIHTPQQPPRACVQFAQAGLGSRPLRAAVWGLSSPGPLCLQMGCWAGAGGGSRAAPGLTGRETPCSPRRQSTAGELERCWSTPFSKWHNTCSGTMAFSAGGSVPPEAPLCEKEERKERWSAVERGAGLRGAINGGLCASWHLRGLLSAIAAALSNVSPQLPARW